MKTLFFIIAVLIPSNVLAFNFTNRAAITTIVGEASNQGPTGMVMIGEAIRNRHSLRGCYGLTATHNSQEPQYVWDMAEKAWGDSATSRLTHGATGWGSKQDWSMTWFRRDKIITAIWKGQIFYKESKNGSHHRKAQYKISR